MANPPPKRDAAMFKSTFVPGSGYYVFNPDGLRVSGPYGCKEKALMARDKCQVDADMQARRIVRPCMTCSEDFQSDGPHNRMCTSCRARSDDGPGYRYVNPRKRSG